MPTLNADFIIKMLIELMQNPNAENPQEAEIARELLTDASAF